jgi:hypothetical protein
LQLSSENRGHVTLSEPEASEESGEESIETIKLADSYPKSGHFVGLRPQ